MRFGAVNRHRAVPKKDIPSDGAPSAPPLPDTTLHDGRKPNEK
jgi:hypothetical protein